MDELALLQDYATHRDESAFVAIVERYLGKLYGTAYRRTGDRLLAEEIVQDVFTALAKKAHCMDANTVLACWLHRAVVLRSTHVMRTEYRRKRKMQSYAQNQPEEDTEVIDSSGELRYVLDQAIDTLDSEDRRLVLLRFMDDLTIREIAARLGMSKSSVQRQSEQALEKLSTILKHWDVAIPAAALASALSTEFAIGAPASWISKTVSQTAIQSASTVTITPILIMTKTPVLIAIGGLLIALSTVGGMKLGKSQAQSNRFASIEPAPTSPANQGQLGESTTLPTDDPPIETTKQEDRMAQLIAKILTLATDEAVDPKNAKLQALLAQIAEHELPDAFRCRDAINNSEHRSLLGGLLMMRWSAVNGPAAAAALSEYAQRENRDWYTMVVAGTWAESDPKAALHWQQTPDETNTISNETRRQMLVTIFQPWVESDRAAALAALAKLSYDNQKSAVRAFARNSSEAQKILNQIGGHAE